MKIKVEQKHIDSGIKSRPQLCPIALAVKDEIRDARRVSVGYFYVGVTYNDGEVHHYELGTDARTFMLYFDATGEGEPTEFEFHMTGQNVIDDIIEELEEEEYAESSS